MKTLILLRHAKSSWKHPELDDFDRPLNKRGLHDAPVMGRRLAQHEALPDRCLSSPAVRAAATVMAVAEALGYPVDAIAWEPRIYEATSATLLDIVRQQPDNIEHILLVGHNPGLTDFANALTGDTLDNLPTAAAYTLTLPIEHWRDAAFGSGTRNAYEYPKDRN
ncbi:MAG: histidine phosphatase family protein [Acidihalobacter sp.]|uniref:SixA phosphatase family protein n=1 Tax=Acidihalobacter sp. TaxID=1872108 RepID=UPI00307D2452